MTAAFHRLRREQHATAPTTKPGDAQRLRAATAILDELHAGAPAPLVILSDERCSHVARGRRGRPARLWLSRSAVDAGPSALRGELAHEYAHIVDRAHKRDITLKLVGWLLLASIAISASMLYPAMVAPGTGTVTVLAVWCAGWLAWGCAGWWVRFVNHRLELRADRTAADLLGSVEPVLAMLERLDAIRAGHNRRQRIEAWFTHPSPERRRRALTGT